MHMEELCLTSLQRKLLQIIQSDFPLVSRPYQELARQVGTSEEEVIEVIRQLCARGIIRDLAPVFDYGRLGYVAYFHGMLEAGVALAPSHLEAAFVSTAHSDADIAQTIEASRAAFERAARV